MTTLVLSSRFVSVKSLPPGVLQNPFFLMLQLNYRMHAKFSLQTMEDRNSRQSISIDNNFYISRPDMIWFTLSKNVQFKIAQTYKQTNYPRLDF